MTEQIPQIDNSATAFTAFEVGLIRWFINNRAYSAVADQLRLATLASREYTGAGLYLNLTLPSDSLPLIRAGVRSPIFGPQISAPDLPNGAGSLLFHADGRVQVIEVFTYTDELSSDLPVFEFQEVIRNEQHASPDGVLTLSVEQKDGDVAIGFDGLPWHTHADTLASLAGLPESKAVRAYVDSVVNDESVIAMLYDGEVLVDAWVVDTVEPQKDKYLQPNESTRFRYWSGKQYEISNS